MDDAGGLVGGGQFVQLRKVSARVGDTQNPAALHGKHRYVGFGCAHGGDVLLMSLGGAKVQLQSK